MTKQKVLVTGGSGFFGSCLADGLLKNDYHVKILDKEDWHGAGTLKNTEFIKADIRDKNSINKALENIDYIFHNAAILPISRSNKNIFWKINVLGTRNVLEAALCNAVKKVVFISSSAVYGIPKELPITEKTEFNPICNYGRSKAEAERVCNEFRGKGLDITILRPRTIIGKSRLGIFQILYSWIADNKNVYIIGRGNNLFQDLGINDLINACILCLQEECKNEDFNLGADKFETLEQEVWGLIDYAKSSSKVIPIPAGFARLILRGMDFLNLIPFTSWHYMTFDKSFYFDSSKAKKMLGWYPKASGSEMFKEGYDWYLAHRKEADSRFGKTHKNSVRQGILKVLKFLP
jgi:nucleoside-diphosphate-sugar epimerase